MATWYQNIPAGNQSFSVSQGQLQTNTNTVDSVFGFDHIPFSSGTTTQGQHKQITFPENHVPGAQTGLASTEYTNVGTALNAASQLFWINSQTIFHLSAIRAWGFVNGLAGGIIASQSHNVTSAVRNAVGRYTVTLPGGTVNSANYAIFLTSSNSPATGTAGITAEYKNQTLTTFDVIITDTNSAVQDPNSFCFAVIQI